MSRDAPPSPAEDSLVGRVINERYRVVAAVSRDHVGRVYRAEQLPLGRPVSIKVLDPRQRRHDDGQLQQRFLIEASIASRLQHPNTVHVFDYGCTPDGLCFTSFELIEGRTLTAVLAAAKPFSAERTLHVALQMARSLREAHRMGIIHGSVKPASVLLTRHGDEEDFVKLCDFGMVRPTEVDDLEELTQQSMFTGAPKYMAPERIRGDRSDARADVYSLGACMYEMLTGRVPFDRPGAVQLLMAHMQEPVAPIERFDCPPALSRLVMRCLAKAPVERPASMDDVIVLLKQAAGHSLHATMPILISRELALTPPALPTERDALAAPALATQAQPSSTAPAPSMQPQPHPNAWLPKLAVVGAIMLAAGFLALRQRPVSGASAGAAQSEVAPVAPRTVAALASRPTAPADAFRLRVRLSSLPAGAYVEVSGKRYGPTPADVELWGEAVRPGSELTFVFDKPGFEPASVTRLVRGENLALEVVLGRSGGSTERPRAAEQRPPEPAAPATSYTQLEQWPALGATPEPSPAPVAAPAPAPAQPAWKPIAPADAAPAAKPAAKPRAAPPTVAKHSALLRDGSQKFPEYPRAALRAGISGVVVARVYVKADGRVGAVDVLDGPDVFHEAVRKALMTWRYSPARTADGSALPDTHIVRVPFQLK
jgi:TonB family protein